MQGGEFRAVGAGQSISGYRADIGIIDDPFGSREDAWSSTVQEKRWAWFTDDFSPRMKPAGKRVLIATRWAELDISGRLIAQAEAGYIRAKVINLPAIAEENDPLDRKPGEFLWAGPPSTMTDF